MLSRLLQKYLLTLTSRISCFQPEFIEYFFLNEYVVWRRQSQFCCMARFTASHNSLFRTYFRKCKPSDLAVKSSRNQPATHCFHNFAMILTARIHVSASRQHKGDTVDVTLVLEKHGLESPSQKFALLFFKVTLQLRLQLKTRFSTNVGDRGNRWGRTWQHDKMQSASQGRDRMTMVFVAPMEADYRHIERTIRFFATAEVLVSKPRAVQQVRYKQRLRWKRWPADSVFSARSACT